MRVFGHVDRSSFPGGSTIHRSRLRLHPNCSLHGFRISQVHLLCYPCKLLKSAYLIIQYISFLHLQRHKKWAYFCLFSFLSLPSVNHNGTINQSGKVALVNLVGGGGPKRCRRNSAHKKRYLGSRCCFKFTNWNFEYLCWDLFHMCKLQMYTEQIETKYLRKH